MVRRVHLDSCSCHRWNEMKQNRRILWCIQQSHFVCWGLVRLQSANIKWVPYGLWGCDVPLFKKNEWVLNKTGVKRELLDTVKARKLAYYGHTMRKQGSCLEKEIMQGTMPGACRRGSPRTAWMDNINTWTGLPVEESIRMTEDRDKWRKYVYGVADPGIEDG